MRSNTRKATRWAAAVVAVCGTITALTACGTSSQSASGGGHVTLSYAIWQTDEKPGYTQIIKQFEAENPNISVQLEVVPWASYWSKLYTEATTGTQPDVFTAMPSYLPDLVKRNAMIPLDDLIKKDNVSAGAALPALTKAFKVGGKSYGIEKDWDAFGIFYNQPELSAAGLNAPPADLTWSPSDGGSFVTAMQKLTLDANGKHPNDPGFQADNIKQYGYAYLGNNVDPADMTSWIYSNGGEIVDSAGKLHVNSRQNVETFTYLKDLIYKYHVAPSYQALISATPFSLFSAGKVAAWQTVPPNVAGVASSATFKFNVGLMPAGPAGRWTRVNGLVDEISSSTKHQAEAWKFLKFIASKSGQETLGKTGVILPVLPAGTAESVNYWASKGIDTKAFSTAVRGAGNHVAADPVIPNFAEFDDVWDKVIGQILSNQVSVTQGLDEIQSQGTSIVGG